MDRTTIMLPNTLKNQAMKLANKEGVSLGEFIRESIIIKLSEACESATDPFFADSSYYGKKTPSDVAVNHDQYLYGD